MLVSFKDFDIEIEGPFTFSGKNKVEFNWTYSKKTTRGTKFQAKKALKRLVVKAMKDYIECQKKNAEVNKSFE